MKRVLSPKKQPWSSSAKRALWLAAVILAAAAAVHAADEAKGRVRAVRDLAKQGPTAIPQIGGYLSDPEVSVRLEAVKSIVQLDTQGSLDPLVKATADNNAEIQTRATDGLVNFYAPGYTPTGFGAPIKKLTISIKGKFTDMNDQVVDAYVQVRPEVIQALGKLCRGGASMNARSDACRGLGVLRGKAALPDLIAAVRSNDTEVNYEAIIAIQKIRDSAGAEVVTSRLHDPVEKVQVAAIETTGVLDNRSALNQLRDVMDRSKNPKVRRAALTALAMMPDPSMHGVFVYRMEDKNEDIRVAALEGLARLRDPADEGRIEKAYNDETKTAGRMAAAFGLVSHGKVEMKQFSPLRYLADQLNSGGYRDVAIAYLKELARTPAVRQALYGDLQTDPPPTKYEKTGLAQVLGASGDRDSIPVLETLSKDPDTDVDKEALRAIQNIRVRVSG